jgi:uncharacterized protein YbjT (DUF2867 family)
MSTDTQPILVFGATGQQGGSVAIALLKAGRRVRAFAKRIGSAEPAALAGAEMIEGDLADAEAIRAAMKDAVGVYSALPSSATENDVTDDDEVRWGINIADIAVESGVRHLVYSSSNGAGHEPTGIAQYEAKTRIEEHVRTLPITTTIIRPAGFMETLMMPGSGLDEGRFSFFVRPDQPIQLVAVEDIGKVVAAIFADPERFGGVTLEVASDKVTGHEIEIALTEAAGHPIVYSRFSSKFLSGHPELRKMSELVDKGPLAGNADLNVLRALVPDLTSFRSWLSGSGRKAFEKAVGSAGTPSRGDA